MPILLYQQSNIEISWDEKEKWLYVRWNGPQTVAEIQRDCEQMLRFMTAKNADSILHDNSNVEGGWIAAADWMAKDWFPRMRQAGLKYFAWVHSRPDQLPPDATPGVSIPAATRIFTSALEAGNWLRIQRRRDAARTQRIVLPPGIGRG